MKLDDKKRFDWTMHQFVWTKEQFDECMEHFIATEIEAGITFASVALGSTTEERRQRNRDNARKAYDSAIHFWRHPLSDRTAQQELFARKGELEYMLRQLGESF